MLRRLRYLAVLPFIVAAVVSSVGTAHSVDQLDADNSHNQASFWEDTYFANTPNVECVKVDDDNNDDGLKGGPDNTEYGPIDAAPAGKVWVAIILKTGQNDFVYHYGSDFIVGDTIHTLNAGPQGQRQAISHVFRCYAPAPATTTTVATTSTTQPTTTSTLQATTTTQPTTTTTLQETTTTTAPTTTTTQPTTTTLVDETTTTTDPTTTTSEVLASTLVAPTTTTTVLAQATTTTALAAATTTTSAAAASTLARTGGDTRPLLLAGLVLLSSGLLLLGRVRLVRLVRRS